MTFYDVIDILFMIFFGVILWPVAVGLRQWMHIGKANQLLTIFLVLLMCLEIYAYVLAIFKIRNHYIHYLNTLLIIWFTVFFYSIGKKNVYPSYLLAAIVSICIPVEIIVLVGYNNINTVTEFVARMILVVYAFNALKSIIKDLNDSQIHQNSNLYIQLGLFIYGFFSAITSMFKKYFIETALDLYFFCDTLSFVMGAVAFCLFAIGLRLSTSKKINTYASL
ncbi:hypothetical protein [Fibrella aquatilis]|uniref:Uncharacterized protein n=1 Tax=Fibrella aquatilis TaxID=2817059 RepID=A0A939JW90_9BACT|nr:hypothetical protein [Fibrella aquatilis]MBO0929739.1 hypothetical protein [Fibrella aquatilis]